MADFPKWATAWPARTFARASGANRMAAIEGIIDADPVAACVRAGITSICQGWMILGRS
jgi:hypothetical protein